LFNLTERSILKKIASLEEKERELYKVGNSKKYIKAVQKRIDFTEKNKRVFDRYIE
jgi:hypothetical protein